MTKESSKFHCVMDFGQDLTLEQAEQYLKSPFVGTPVKIEDVGIASDRILQVYLPPKDFDLLWKRARYEGNYLGRLAREIIQKSLSEWEKEVEK